MNTQQLQASTNAAIDYWISECEKHTLEELTARPPDGWSLGQVGIHLWMSAKGFFFKNAEKCFANDGTQTGGSKTFSGHLVFTFKVFPPVKYKMPKQVAVEPKQPETKEQLIAKLQEVKQMAAGYIQRMPESQPNIKIRHPFLGWLNAAEWIQLCNLHFNHHLRQKKRIEQHFGWK